MEIVVSWVGITKSKEVAGVLKPGRWKACDETIGGKEGDPKKKWFLAGNNFDGSGMVKGQKYYVLVGTDNYGNQYINAYDEGGLGMSGLNTTPETPKEIDTTKPIMKGFTPVPEAKKDDSEFRSLLLACTLSDDWETAKALAKNVILPYLKGK